MKRSLADRVPVRRRAALSLFLTGVLATGVHADYQALKAARTSPAFLEAPVVTIDEEALRDSFSPESLDSDPALSDSDVMLELNQRMASDDRLAQAAENLAPEQPALVQTSSAPSSDTEHTADAEQSAEGTGVTAAVASR